MAELTQEERDKHWGDRCSYWERRALHAERRIEDLREDVARAELKIRSAVEAAEAPLREALDEAYKSVQFHQDIIEKLEADRRDRIAERDKLREEYGKLREKLRFTEDCLELVMGEEARLRERVEELEKELATARFTADDVTLRLQQSIAELERDKEQIVRNMQDRVDALQRTGGRDCDLIADALEEEIASIDAARALDESGEE